MKPTRPFQLYEGACKWLSQDKTVVGIMSNVLDRDDTKSRNQQVTESDYRIH